MINGIGKSISGQFDNITSSINTTFKAVEHKGFKGFYAPFQIAHAMFLGKIQNIINNIALGKDADIILADPKMSKKFLFDKIALQSRKYRDALADAEFRGVFKIWLAEYANTLMETLKIAQPEIDRVNDEIKNIIEDMGDNIGNSLGHALTNVITSVVSALPGVGGVIGAIKSADQLGQDLIKGCEPLSQGAGIIMEGVNTLNKEKSRLECEVNKFEKKVEPIMKRIESIQQVGGANKNMKKKIKNTTKRVHYLLNRFTSQSKTNYTRRLKRRN
jgi:chaperonin cofactor prefoldin